MRQLIAKQRKHQSSASLAFVGRIHRLPLNSPKKGQKRGKCLHLMTSSCEYRTPTTTNVHVLLGFSLRWRHNARDGVSNHQPHDCLLNVSFRHRSNKTSKLRVTGLCVGNSPGTAQRASYAENVSISWRHHVFRKRPWFKESTLHDSIITHNTTVGIGVAYIMYLPCGTVTSKTGVVHLSLSW